MAFKTAVLVFLAVVSLTSSRPSEDTSVVSVYTTQPTTSGTTSGSSLDVYTQIANNIAERISTPVIKFFGFNTNKSEEKPATKSPWSKLELLEELDSTEEVNSSELNNIDKHEITINDGDLKKDKRGKPEKVILYSSLLSLNSSDAFKNVTNAYETNKLDDVDVNLRSGTEVTKSTKSEGFLTYILEMIGSFFQLVMGAFQSLIRPKKES